MSLGWTGSHLEELPGENRRLLGTHVMLATQTEGGRETHEAHSMSHLSQLISKHRELLATLLGNYAGGLEASADAQ